MASKTEHSVTDFQQKNLNVAMKLAQLSIENAQRILQMQVEVSRDIFDDSLENADQLAHIQSPQDVMEVRARYARQAAEKMFACSRMMASVTAEMQSEMTRMVSERLASNGQEFFGAMEELMQGAPLNSHAAAEVLQHAFDSARKSLEQVSKASAEAFAAFIQPPNKR
jgi:phasin family protein